MFFAIAAAAAAFSWSLYTRQLRHVARAQSERGRTVTWTARGRWAPSDFRSSGRRHPESHVPLTVVDEAADRTSTRRAVRELRALITNVRPARPAWMTIAYVTASLFVNFAVVMQFGAGETAKTVFAWTAAVPLGLVWGRVCVHSQEAGEFLPRLSLAPFTRAELTNALDAVVRRDVMVACGLTIGGIIAGTVLLNADVARSAVIALAAVSCVPIARVVGLRSAREPTTSEGLFVTAFPLLLTFGFFGFVGGVWFNGDDPGAVEWALLLVALLILAATVRWLRHEQHWWATADLALLERQGE